MGNWQDNYNKLGKELAETIHDRAVLLDALKVAQVHLFMLEGASETCRKINDIIDTFEPSFALCSKS